MTSLQAGTLALGSDTALGSGPITITGGGIRAVNAVGKLANTLNINGSFTLGRSTTFAGTTNLNTDATVFLDNPDAPANSDSAIGNIASSTHSLTIANGPLHGAGSGYLDLATNNSFTGTLTVNTNVRIGGSATTDNGIVGNIVVNAPGVLLFNQANIVKNTSTLTVFSQGTAGPPGTVNFSNFGDAIATISGDGAITNVGLTGLTLDLGSSATFSGTISGTGPLIVRGNNGAGTQTLSSANTYSGGTTVSGGTLAIANTAALGTGGLTISTGATAKLAQSLGKPLALPSFSVSGTGKLDLANNSMVVNYTSSSPLAAIRAALVSGFNNLAWTGAGIDSSVAASNSNHTTALGYAEASQLGLDHGRSFDGQSIANEAVLIKYTYYGDENLDGVVNLDDFSIFIDGFNGLGSGWIYGDFNYDGVIDRKDFSLFVQGFNLNGQPLSQLENAILAEPGLSASQRGAMLAVVPEPSGIVLTAAAGLALLGRRTKKAGVDSGRT